MLLVTCLWTSPILHWETTKGDGDKVDCNEKSKKLARHAVGKLRQACKEMPLLRTRRPIGQW